MFWLLSPVLLFRFGSPGLGPRAVQDSLFVQERFPLNSSLLCSSGDLSQTDLLHFITATLWNHAALFSDTDLCGFEGFFRDFNWKGVLVFSSFWVPVFFFLTLKSSQSYLSCDFISISQASVSGMASSKTSREDSLLRVLELLELCAWQSGESS